MAIGQKLRAVSIIGCEVPFLWNTHPSPPVACHTPNKLSLREAIMGSPKASSRTFSVPSCQITDLEGTTCGLMFPPIKTDDPSTESELTFESILSFVRSV